MARGLPVSSRVYVEKTGSSILSISIFVFAALQALIVFPVIFGSIESLIRVLQSLFALKLNIARVLIATELFCVAVDPRIQGVRGCNA